MHYFGLSVSISNKMSVTQAYFLYERVGLNIFLENCFIFNKYYVYISWMKYKNSSINCSVLKIRM
jgi:hypothetical protein